MAKSSISADVTAANSKLAQYLRRKEEEEMILQIGKRKPKQLREEKRMPTGRGRWSATPDFKVPTCMVDRPRTEAGATSFHFSYISISKEGVPTLKGKPLESFSTKKAQPALDHSIYIEREGAAEASRGADHAVYVERPGAIETLDPNALIAEAIESRMASVVNENPTDEEAHILGLNEFAPDSIPSVFSNISDNPFERQEYWRAVERSERTPKQHKIILDPEASPRWWDALANAANLNPAFKNHALMIAEQYHQYRESPTEHDEPKDPFIAEPFPPAGSDILVDTEHAGRLIEQAMQLPGFDYSRPPIEFQSGRGGRVQIRMVAELPHELSPEDRALIVQNFCDKIANLVPRKNPDGSERMVGMMYTAVIHAPDSHNDRRNYHLHVVAHDRPARYLEEEGKWDFEYEEHYNHKGENRIRYPYRQDKIIDAARVKNSYDPSRAGPNFIPSLRKDFADITNTVLKARGIERRYDPRKYTEMGIERTPTQHLGTKAAALESIGVPTTVGLRNAIAIWSDAERNVERQAAQAEKAYTSVQERLRDLAAQVTAVEPANPSLARLRTLMVERERLTKTLAEDRRAVMAFDQLEAKAKSRAVRTRQTCLQYLADIENGVADNSTRMMQLAIRDRFRAAQAHIQSIDKSLEPHREPLELAAKDIESRETRVGEIDRELAPIEERLRKLLAAASLRAPVSRADKPKRAAKKSKDDKAKNPAGADQEVDGESLENIVITGPVTIGGLPITKGTISKPEPVRNDRTPEGLQPLRPEPDKASNKAEPTVIAKNLESDEPVKTPSDQKAKEDAQIKSEQPKEEDRAVRESASAKAVDSPQVEKVDKRRKNQEPTLFELPSQEPPVKPGTSKAEQTDWHSLLNRISDDRIQVKKEELPGGKIRHTVPSLSEDEQALLKTKRFAKRTAARLAAIHQSQQLEIARALRWIAENGKDRDLLLIEGRSAQLGDAPKAVITLFNNWGSHILIKKALLAESERRIEEDKARAKAQASRQENASSPNRELLERVREIYPAPDQVFTPEVAEFTRLLRNLASRDELQAAADEIYEDSDARDDVMDHTVELATAYRRLVAGTESRAVHSARARAGRER